MMDRAAASLKRLVSFSPLVKHTRYCSSAVDLIRSSSDADNNVGSPSIRKDNYIDRPWWEEASIYVHWPYCQKRCTYCNFNKYIVPKIDQERMKHCLVTELCTLVDLSGVKVVNSVFFGGGTPSLAEPRVIGAVIDAVRETVAMPTDCEITMEANPTSLEMAKLEEFRLAGINRLSLGIQALNSNDLGLLGRDHTLKQSLTCIYEARALFCHRLSIDIIFGRPGQTLQSWSDELDQVLDICDDHISLYQLTLEPGTLLYKMAKRGLLSVPHSDLIAEMYEMAVSRLKEAGFHRYEVSNFARSVSAESLHNKCYWDGKQYIGIGPGAHGRFCLAADQGGLSGGNGESESCVGKRESHISGGNNDSHFQHMNDHKEKHFGKLNAIQSHLHPHPVWRLNQTPKNKSQFVETGTCGTPQIQSNLNTNLSQASFISQDDRSQSVESNPWKPSQSAPHAGFSSEPFPREREARIQTLEPEAWMREVEKHGHATRKRVVQSRTDMLRELLLTGLRVPEGIRANTWEKFMTGFSLLDTFGESDFLKEVVENGLMEIDTYGLRCSDKGLNVLDSLLPSLVEHLTIFCEGNDIK